MTTLITGLNTAIRACFVSMQGCIYEANNFDTNKVWDGVRSTMVAAGIAAPAAAMASPSAASGNVTNGAHLARCRYRNSKTGYISNPSATTAVTVSSGNGQLTFTVVASSDSKVDKIDIELTPVNSGVYYRAASGSNANGTIVVSITDANLIQQFNADANYGSAENLDTFRNEVPPLGAILMPYKGRMFIGGDEPYTITGTFTDTTTGVTGTGFSANWVGRLVQVSGESVSYEISAATTTTLTLTVAWSGTTGSKTASVYSKTPNRVYYSPAGFPESFYTSVYARDLLQNRSDQLTGLYGRRDGLYCFGRYSGERLVFNDDPSAATSVIVPIFGNRGVFNQRCLVEADGRLFAFDRAGVYEVGETPQHISAKLDLSMAELLDYSYASSFHGCFDPVDRVLMWFCVATGDTTPKRAICFEIDTGRVFWHRFLQGITASAIVPTTDGQVRVMLGDENGYTWYFSIEGSYDGTPPATSAVVTVTGSPTTTVIPVTETLSTSPSCAGVVVYNPLTTETAVCSSNTSSALTVGSGFASAPTVGQDLYLGAIPFEYRTKWLTSQGMESKKAPIYLIVKLYPGSSTGKLRVYIYQDFSSSPTTLTATASDLFNDGVNITSGNTYAELDLDAGSGDGFIAMPIDYTFKRAIQARLLSTKPTGELRILDAYFSLTRTGEKQVENE